MQATTPKELSELHVPTFQFPQLSFLFPENEQFVGEWGNTWFAKRKWQDADARYLTERRRSRLFYQET